LIALSGLSKPNADTFEKAKNASLQNETITMVSPFQDTAAFKLPCKIVMDAYLLPVTLSGVLLLECLSVFSFNSFYVVSNGC
jgi:hypothetical protein